LILKRAMDVFYASVGTAVTYTGGDTDKMMSYSKTMATAAAAGFYYTITGASRRANEVTSSAKSARDLIQNAWGMVSLSGVKQLSLQASRLLKGAAVADLIEIAGVQCFVLSADPSPELAAAVTRSKRRTNSRHHRRVSSSNAIIPRLMTINEEEDGNEDEGDEDSLNSSSQSSIHSSTLKPFARCPLSHRQRDVILHFTGGGFFAHIIASDLPYLMDWSAATGAVIVCPEYALLPQHAFPVALEQVERVYRTLIGEKVDCLHDEARKSSGPSLLGFEVNQITITGESTGGNLAAALCVKIAMENKKISDDSQRLLSKNVCSLPLHQVQDTSSISLMNKTISIEQGKKDALLTPGDNDYVDSVSTKVMLRRMPDALMLSCPVLNLSLEMSHSRAIGTNDPVLPSGLLSAISEAYLPSEQPGIDKKNPLASPLFASDLFLAKFPKTLVFASSTDPLLDDSVVFIQRLRYVGVQAELYAACNLPHAYLGLGTAGFPEAREVQERCIRWLNQQLGHKCK
jgi:acetyl esterase/lipase